MELVNNLILGFGTALTPLNLVYCFAGVLIGTLIGVLPGIGPVATLAMLLPTTYALPPVSALMAYLAFGERIKPSRIGRRDTFSDLGATVADWFGIDFRGRGRSFLPTIT